MNELNIPETWAETEVGNAISLKNGFAFKSKDFTNNGVPVIRISNIQENKVELVDTKKIEEKEEYDKFQISKGDLLVAMSGATTGKMGVYNFDDKAYLNQRVGNLQVISEDYIDLKYRNYFFKNVSSDILDKAYGGAQPNISGSMIEELAFPIPPMAEQVRIVQKIESCFEKVDETESSLNKVEKLLEKYRESLLAKAFRGELIPQNPDDEPASVLLSKIRAEREKAETSKKKKVQAFEPITDDEKPFDIPESWEWVRLSEIVKPEKIITYGIVQAGPHVEDGVPYIRVTDMVGDELSPENMKRTNNDIAKKFERSKVNEGDIVYALRGRIGDVMIVPSSLDGANLTQGTARISVSHLVDRDYVLWVMRSPVVLRQSDEKKKGTTFKEITLTALREFVIPLPPVREQKNISSKMLRLDSDFRKIKKSSKSKFELLIKLKMATLAKAFEGRLVEQIESEGTGQELLEKILKAKAEEAPKKKVTKKKTTKKK